jgi:cytochrome b561
MTNQLQAAHISATQRRLHWATFIAISVVFVAALIHESVDSGSARGLSLSLHELFGLAVLLLAVIRLFLVATGRRSSVIRGLAPRAGHTLLYLALLYQPLIGIFTAQATGGKALKLFSWQLPQWLPADEDFATALLELHEWIAWAFLALILGHIAMALWHVFVTGDKHSREMFQEPELDNERQTS